MMRASIAILAITATMASAQSIADARGACLMFDGFPFKWQYLGRLQRWTSDSSAVIALDTARVRGPDGARRLDPLPTGAVDTWTKSPWAPSYWRALGADSIVIEWTTMLTGSHFVLSGRDTLRGTVRDFSDVVAVGENGRRVPEPPPRSIRAIRTACRAVGPTTGADSLALMNAIYLVALSNGTQTAHAATGPEVVCARGLRPDSDPPAAVIDALQKDRSLLIRPMSACIQEPVRSTRDGSLVVDTLTGKRGISISVTEPVFAADGSFKFDTGYYQHGLSSAGWTCFGRRRSDQAWEVTRCTMNWIS
jgi:hypothetical protein